ncbi:helix-turn-helix domain-containing protein [Mesobacillus subterraneus]|uniref:helix-turn-helix domain-containing protein n=1 Tax=Mesobacillus subterraneus TaxID=285983 RepID=UPI00203D3D80|nr:helix-turn-helix transcriptional regulator [Mesobacillus subterraneus]MCM3573265.1 helix-turn-helix domain-containing protein [Mesobacillus subterraneus]
MYQESLGTRLRMERFKRNLTQAQVCKEIGMKVDTLSQIENDKGTHFDSTLQRLLDYYEIDKKVTN